MKVLTDLAKDQSSCVDLGRFWSPGSATSAAPVCLVVERPMPETRAKIFVIKTKYRSTEEQINDTSHI